MTWLYIPSTSQTSAPAQARVRSESGSHSDGSGYTPFCTSSGTATPRPLSWRGWRTRPWIRLLSGMTLPPAPAQRVLQHWLAHVRSSSQQDTPASHSPVPVNVLANRMSAIYGHTLMSSLKRANPNAVSSRTSQATFPWATPESEEVSSGEATALRRDYSQRLRWAQATEGSGSSSSVWPTPAARDYREPNGPEHLTSGSGATHLDQLPNFVRHCSHRAQQTPSGQTCSQPGRTSRRRLNPEFVELLMGWPIGWTRTDCAVPATEWSRWLPLMRSCLYGLLCSVAKAR